MVEGAGGYEVPLREGVHEESAVSSGRDATEKRCKSFGETINVMGTTEDFRGGYAGDWKSPRKVGVVVPRTPCAHSVRMTPSSPSSLSVEELRKT